MFARLTVLVWKHGVCQLQQQLHEFVSVLGLGQARRPLLDSAYEFMCFRSRRVNFVEARMLEEFIIVDVCDFRDFQLDAD